MQSMHYGRGAQRFASQTVKQPSHTSRVDGQRSPPLETRGVSGGGGRTSRAASRSECGQGAETRRRFSRRGKRRAPDLPQVELEEVDEIGEKIAESLIEYFSDDKKRLLIERLKSFGLQPG